MKLKLNHLMTIDRIILPQKNKKVLNFKTNKTIKNAVEDLHAAFNKNLFNDPLNNEMYFNIKRMKSQT